ncbi:MAG: peptide chain release factor N(5)-glutamine methyltransferase [Lachnospiraceae bacterium]
MRRCDMQGSPGEAVKEQQNTQSGEPVLREQSLGGILREGEAYLRSCGIADASVDAWLLMEYVTGISRAIFLAQRRSRMSEADCGRYRSLLRKRGSHIPLQHLTGEQEFMGFSFAVNEHVLIPRQDTELLAEEALRYLRPGMRVLDLCTGSGCIAVSLAKLCPGIHVDAADISQEALAVARENASRLGADVCFVQSDLFSALSGTYDMIVSNPPYIRTEVIGTLSEEVRLHEPHLALDGMEDGLYFYRRIIDQSPVYLRSGGRLLFEIGYDQGKQVLDLFETAGYRENRVLRDLAGLDRVVLGKRAGGDICSIN